MKDNTVLGFMGEPSFHAKQEPVEKDVARESPMASPLSVIPPLFWLLSSYGRIMEDNPVIKDQTFNRICLKCDIPFTTPEKFLRLCLDCRRLNLYDSDIDSYRCLSARKIT